jgi:hypothetical protein
MLAAALEKRRACGACGGWFTDSKNKQQAAYFSDM